MLYALADCFYYFLLNVLNINIKLVLTEKRMGKTPILF